jgi:hypothetical protein
MFSHILAEVREVGKSNHFTTHPSSLNYLMSSPHLAFIILFYFSSFLQLGSHIKDTVFKSEATASAIHGWRKKAKDKHKEHGAHHHETPLAKKPLGILGLTKELDKHGHPVDIELPHTNGAQHRDRLEAEERELDQAGTIHIQEHGHEKHHPHPHPQRHNHHPQGTQNYANL